MCNAKLSVWGIFGSIVGTFDEFAVCKIFQICSQSVVTISRASTTSLPSVKNNKNAKHAEFTAMFLSYSVILGADIQQLTGVIAPTSGR